MAMNLKEALRLSSPQTAKKFIQTMTASQLSHRREDSVGSRKLLERRLRIGEADHMGLDG